MPDRAHIYSDEYVAGLRRYWGVPPVDKPSDPVHVPQTCTSGGNMDETEESAMSEPIFGTSIPMMCREIQRQWDAMVSSDDPEIQRQVREAIGLSVAERMGHPD